MIAFPPIINGVPVLWRGARGVMHPIVACGVPLDKAQYAINAALKDVSNGCSHLQQEFIDNYLVNDWTALLYLEEGQQLPTSIKFHKTDGSTPIFPAHIAVPCMTCRRRNPDHCLCPAPLCHHVHKERRTAEQAAASLAIADEAAQQEAAAILAAQRAAESEKASSMVIDPSPTESEAPITSAISAALVPPQTGAPIKSAILAGSAHVPPPFENEALPNSAILAGLVQAHPSFENEALLVPAILAGSALISPPLSQSAALSESATLAGLAHATPPFENEAPLVPAFSAGSAPISPTFSQSAELPNSAILTGAAPAPPPSSQCTDALTPSVVGMPQVPAVDRFVMNNDDASPAQSDVEMDDD
ncbi:hypothetical protein FBU31_007007, partial [Coemansia sp. 'formosensis']